MRTFDSIPRLFLLVAFCLAVTTTANDAEIEIVGLDEDDESSTTGNPIEVTDTTDESTEPMDETTWLSDTTTEAPTTGPTPTTTTEPPTTTTEPPATTTQPPTTTTQPPVTTTQPVWEEYQTRINIFNTTEADFIENNEEPFKASVAKYVAQYCNESGLDCGIVEPVTGVPELTTPEYPAMTTQESPVVTTPDSGGDELLPLHISGTSVIGAIGPEDVNIEQRVQVGSDLQIGYFVQLTNGDMLPREILDDVMVVYGDEIALESGINFEVIPPEEVPTTSTTTTPPEEIPGPPGGGLEPWEIALIVMGSVAGVAIIAGAVYYLFFRKKKDTSSSFRELDYESTSRRLYDTERPEHTYESITKNRQSIPPDSNNGASTTFNNASYENSAYDMNESDNRR